MDKISYLNEKESIIKDYKKYKKRKTITNLAHIANHFNLQLDEERNKDYILESLNLDIPSINIYDKKTNTLYKGTYKIKENENLILIELITLNYDGLIEQIYEDVSSTLLTENLTIKNGKQEINLLRKKDIENNSTTLNFTYKNDGITDFIKNFKINDDSYNNSFSSKKIKYEITGNKNFKIYKLNGYSVNNKYNLEGLIIESNKLAIKDLISGKLKNRKLTNPLYNYANSVLIFDSYAYEDDVLKSFRHSLEIYKFQNIIKGYYNIIELENKKDKKDIYQYKFQIPTNDIGNINSHEIDKIIEKISIKKTIFIDMIIKQLEIYKKQNDSKEKRLLKILENKSLQEIALFITSIKQTFFEKISELSQKELENTYIYKKTN